MNNPQLMASLCPQPAQPPKPPILASGIKRKPCFQAARARFTITEFVNPRTHSVSYRVAGSKRDGQRVRENFTAADAARVRQMELEAEFLGSSQPAQLQQTTLSTAQVRLAEAAFLKLGDDWLHLPDAVTLWQQREKPITRGDIPQLDEAVKQFQAWLDHSGLRHHTIRNLKNRVRVFGLSMENQPVNQICATAIELHLARGESGPINRDNNRRAISRFFSWCKERPRHWITTNPCAEITTALPAREKPPEIMTLGQCTALLRAAESHHDGALVPYVAICLFAGLRPFEAARLTRRQVNLEDGEIRLDDWQSKTGGRVVEINPTLRRWLRRYPGVIFPKNWRKQFAAVRAIAGITHWPVDFLRHTAISHHFRRHKSYGLAAEQHGTSERIIKKHYQSRVTTAEMKRFYALAPSKIKEELRNSGK